MLYDTFFNKMIGKEVSVELKDGSYFRGTLHHVDMHYNVILKDLVFSEDQNYGKLRELKSLYIRGSNVKFIGMEELEPQQAEALKKSIGK